MLPFFGEQKRQINLGGHSQAASASDLLGSVKAQREARLELKRKQDAAVRIQAWWRGRSDAERAKEEMRAAFRNDIMGIQGLRCLVLMGMDEQALGLWSQTVANASKGMWSLLLEANTAHGYYRTGILACAHSVCHQLADSRSEGCTVAVDFGFAVSTVSFQIVPIATYSELGQIRALFLTSEGLGNAAFTQGGHCCTGR